MLLIDNASDCTIEIELLLSLSLMGAEPPMESQSDRGLSIFGEELSHTSLLIVFFSNFL